MREQTRARTTNRRAVDEQSRPSQERQHGMSWIEWSVLLALAVALVLATLAAGGPSDTISSLETRTVRVRISQTLWDIAQTHPVPGNTTAQTVEMIRNLNNMNTSTLYAEQLLEVPVREDAFAVAAR